MNDAPQLWLLARSSGLFAYGTLTLAVVAGLTLHTRILGKAVPPAIITVVHQLLSTIGLLATALHVGLLVVDTHANIPLIGAFVPGFSGHRPLATGLGVIGLELWFCIHMSFFVRKWIGVQRWRKLHRATFLTWGLAAAHGITAGTDSSLAWTQNMYAISIAMVAALVGYRALVHANKKPAPPRPRVTHQTTTSIATPSH